MTPRDLVKRPKAAPEGLDLATLLERHPITAPLAHWLRRKEDQDAARGARRRELRTQLDAPAPPPTDAARTAYAEMERYRPAHHAFLRACSAYRWSRHFAEREEARVAHLRERAAHELRRTADPHLHRLLDWVGGELHHGLDAHGCGGQPADEDERQLEAIEQDTPPVGAPAAMRTWDAEHAATVAPLRRRVAEVRAGQAWYGALVVVKDRLEALMVDVAPDLDRADALVAGLPARPCTCQRLPPPARELADVPLTLLRGAEVA